MNVKQSFLDYSPNLYIIGTSTSTTTTSSSSNNNNNNNNTVIQKPADDIPPWHRLLIPSQDLGRMDYFSDSWLLNRERFLQINVETIETVEDACFQVIDDEEGQAHKTATTDTVTTTTTTTTTTRNKMFVDWTDFSVEHLSKWWKSLQTLSHSNADMADQVVHILDTYLHKVQHQHQQKSVTSSSSSSSFPRQAIAMIAFQSYESVPAVGPERGHQLTAYSLAATIASLYQVGFGRIVIGGYKDPSDAERVQDSFDILKSIFDIQQTENPLSLTLLIGDTQVAFVRLEKPWVQTKRVNANIPRGILLGMQKALQNELPTKEQWEWIGGDGPAASQVWKYFYLTEPDTILNTKPEVLPLLQIGLDNHQPHGWAFFPHRWQPIPHEADLPSDHRNSFLSPSRYLSKSVAPFSNITSLQNPWTANAETADGTAPKVLHCCDGGMDKPGRTEAFGTKMKPCGKWWWACGFVSSSKAPAEGAPLPMDHDQEVLELHKRLVPYPMMRLEGGTSVVVAASEMGRRCLPSRIPCAAAV